MRSRIAALGALVAAALLPAPPPARAQAPITMVVTFAPGGAADIVARILAPEFSGALGTQVVVKNTIGASGTIGTAEAARARPDGQTLLFSPVGPIAVQPQFMRGISYSPADLQPICQVSEAPLVMMTPRSSGLRTVGDVVARARAAAGSMPFGSSGIATLPHISMVAWTRAAGTPMVHVPFRGAGEVMMAFAQGSIQVFSDLPATVRQQNLHAIAVFAPARTPEFPDTPAMREAGFDLSFSIWLGLFAPTGLPAPLLVRFDAACERAVRVPALVDGLGRVQMPVVHRNSRDFAAFVTAEIDKYRGIIEASGLRQAE
jgi:tripartite-type tricarboxylate transporter receptor subunit TctC